MARETMIQPETHHTEIVESLAHFAGGVPWVYVTEGLSAATRVRRITQSTDNQAYYACQVVVVNKNHVTIGCSLHAFN